MCWFHMIKKVDDALKSVKNEWSSTIRADISEIQKVKNLVHFEIATKLFDSKWRKKEDFLVDNFLDYFNAQWVKKLPGWFEGN